MTALAAKPETTFTASIHKLLHKQIYHMKNNNQYVGGIADVWYSGLGGDLWVEYKYLPRTPSRAAVKPLTLLSALQAAWLKDRFKEGRNVAVVIGCPDGGVVLTRLAWENEIPAKDFVTLLRSKKELAEFVLEQVA